MTQFFQSLYHQFHGVIGIPDNCRAQEKPFNIVTPVELYGQLAEFVGCEACPPDIVGTAVYAVFAIIDAYIGKKDLKQGNAPTIVGPAVANPWQGGITHTTGAIAPVATA